LIIVDCGSVWSSSLLLSLSSFINSLINFFVVVEKKNCNGVYLKNCSRFYIPGSMVHLCISLSILTPCLWLSAQRTGGPLFKLQTPQICPRCLASSNQQPQPAPKRSVSHLSSEISIEGYSYQPFCENEISEVPKDQIL
jgi:hypothetical protein